MGHPCMTGTTGIRRRTITQLSDTSAGTCAESKNLTFGDAPGLATFVVFVCTIQYRWNSYGLR
eukprot:2523048-Pyramimonas_sp.AAC.1